jgi:hypothetical protein
MLGILHLYQKAETNNKKLEKTANLLFMSRNPQGILNLNQKAETKHKKV